MRWFKFLKTSDALFSEPNDRKAKHKQNAYEYRYVTHAICQTSSNVRDKFFCGTIVGTVSLFVGFVERIMGHLKCFLALCSEIVVKYWCCYSQS